MIRRRSTRRQRAQQAAAAQRQAAIDHAVDCAITSARTHPEDLFLIDIKAADIQAFAMLHGIIPTDNEAESAMLRRMKYRGYRRDTVN